MMQINVVYLQMVPSMILNHLHVKYSLLNALETTFATDLHLFYCYFEYFIQQIRQL